MHPMQYHQFQISIHWYYDILEQESFNDGSRAIYLYVHAYVSREDKWWLPKSQVKNI